MNDMRILLIDDHVLFRRGLHMFLGEANPGAEIVEAESMEQAMTLETTLPELILLKFKVPGVCGFEPIVPLKHASGIGREPSSSCSPPWIFV